MLQFDLIKNGVNTLLCLGAHCDDIEIGCGATILRLVEENPNLNVHWVVLSSSVVRAREARRSADLFLYNCTNRSVVVKEFRNGYFPHVGAQIKDYFEELKKVVNPDLILTHYAQDLHQDHRVTAELTWNTFRNHFILEYEIPKYDGGMGAPNSFIPARLDHCESKVKYMLDCFGSESNKHWFTRDTFMGLMRLRGVECNSPSGHAEAFYCRKTVLGRL
jgi:LmbE family N-acetylglucosaminyl deacetylase